MHSQVDAFTMPTQIQSLHTVDTVAYPYILEQNASVPLKSSEGIIRLNLYRPNTERRVPVLVTYGPYGKDIPYKESVLLITAPFHCPNIHLTPCQLPSKVVL